MKNGGKRKGAGGVNLNGWSKKFGDYYTPEEVWEFVAHVKELAKKDVRVAMWVGDHIFGKAPQPVQGTGTDGALVFEIINYDNKNTNTVQVSASSVSTPFTTSD